MNKYLISLIVVLALGAGFFALTHKSVQAPQNTPPAEQGAPVVGEGEHCGGFIRNAPVCAQGFHCQLKVNMPDTGGTCVADTAANDNGIGEATGPEQDTSTETVKLGKSFTALNSTVTPIAVTEDSRCPQGVQCVWAGTVKVQTHVATNLGTYDYAFELGKPLEREGERITLTSVTPAPKQGTKIASSDYELTFEVQSI